MNTIITFIFVSTVTLVMAQSTNSTLKNPYRKCGHNPLYTSNSVANYMFAMPMTFIEITDSVIYYDVKHYGFKLKNPGLGQCSNFFASNTSCCNSTTLSRLLNHTRAVYESYANITQAPIFALAKDLSGLMAGKNSSCFNNNASMNDFKLPGINGQTSQTVSSSIASAYSLHDSSISTLIQIEKALIKSQSCLLCLATQDWDRFLTLDASVIYSTDYYNSLINNYTTLVTSINSASNTLIQYTNTFLNTKVNQTKCSSLYSNYTTRIQNSTICTEARNCSQFSKDYFGQYLIPGVLWKLYRMYLKRNDAVAMFQLPVMGDGFKSNVSYSPL